MAVTVAATSATIAAGSGTSRTISYAHAAGTDLCVIVLWRSASVTLSSVTYNGAGMTLIVASGQSGGNPGLSASAYRIDDPGAMTANVVVNYTTGTPSFINAYMLDVTGCPSTSPIDSSGSAVDTTSTTQNLTCTYSRTAANTLTVMAGVRARGPDPQTFTGNDSAVEVFDEDNGTNPGMASALYTLQETASGSLTRGILANIGGKFAMVCLSYSTAVLGQPIRKRLGGTTYSSNRTGVW